MNIKKKLVCLTLAATVACSGLTGCYGSYALTSMAHKFCGDIGNKWISSLVHFVLAYPIGGLAMFADFLIFNTIEFWTGSNPIAMGDVYEEMAEDGSKVYAVKNTDGTLSVSMTDAEGKTADFIMERKGNEFRVLNTEGEIIGYHKILK